MKTLKTLMLATTVLGAATAVQAGSLSPYAANDQVQHYLTQNGLLDAPIAADRVALTERASNLGPATRYLSESGLIETPTVSGRFTGPRTDLADVYTDGKRVKHVLTDWGYLDEPVGGSNRTEGVAEASSGDRRTERLR